jgi:hypothetical protein
MQGLCQIFLGIYIAYEISKEINARTMPDPYLDIYGTYFAKEICANIIPE